VPISAVAVRQAKPREKPYRLYDALGLYLEVGVTGSKYWRLKYRFGGKEKRLALGVFPEVSLAEARERGQRARAMLRDGIDPSAQRRADKVARKTAGQETFEAIGREWMSKQSHWAPATREKTIWTLETLAFPWLGRRPIHEISPAELLQVLRRVESRGKYETAQRLQQRCGQVFRYAVATGRASRDVSADLRGALTTPKTKNRAAITEPAKVGALLRAIDGYSGSFVTLCALRLSALVFLRPGEVRRAEWTEVDIDRAEWRIPGAKMKMRVEHVVPLSTQALAILKELRPLTGGGRFLFPCLRDSRSCMSDGTITAALRRLGFTKEEMSAHGFRAMASTMLNEMGWATDVVERQLAHAERNKVRAAYNRALHLPERKRMMQAWADYLDGLRENAQVVPIGVGRVA